jgi:GrpB-like predicted nucleotidyltransferase (UPF0157 family)
MDLREEITLLEDPVWTERYEQERERILEAAGDELLGVYHVGSTAIPDVPGKPALDVLVVFPEYEPMNEVASTLTEQGYDLEVDRPECNLVIRWEDDHAVFVKMHTLDDEEKIRNQLVFRDYVRENDEARREYEQVKRKAATEHPDDERAYTEAKSEVVGSILERALQAGYDEQLPEYLGE